MEKTKNEKTYLSVREAAEYMGFSVSYIYKLVAAQVLPHYAPNGGRILFKRVELDDWIASGKNHKPENKETEYLVIR